MRDVLRRMGVDVEDEDDWKTMIIKTRLSLTDFKDSIVNSKKGYAEILPVFKFVEDLKTNSIPVPLPMGNS